MPKRAPAPDMPPDQVTEQATQFVWMAGEIETDDQGQEPVSEPAAVAVHPDVRTLPVAVQS